jgi:hypothetical protein
MLDIEFKSEKQFLTLYLIGFERIESSSRLDDGVPGVRTLLTLTLDSCNSEPPLC